MATFPPIDPFIKGVEAARLNLEKAEASLARAREVRGLAPTVPNVPPRSAITAKPSRQMRVEDALTLETMMLNPERMEAKYGHLRALGGEGGFLDRWSRDELSASERARLAWFQTLAEASEVIRRDKNARARAEAPVQMTAKAITRAAEKARGERVDPPTNATAARIIELGAYRRGETTK